MTQKDWIVVDDTVYEDITIDIRDSLEAWINLADNGRIEISRSLIESVYMQFIENCDVYDDTSDMESMIDFINDLLSRPPKR